MRLKSRTEARFSTSSANRCDWISISCSETCWTYWLFCSSDIQYSFAYFTVKTKAYNVTISHTVQLCLLFKSVLSFCLNSTIEQYNIIAKFGTFLWATRYIEKYRMYHLKSHYNNRTCNVFVTIYEQLYSPDIEIVNSRKQQTTKLT